jgi:hypothetical protein
MTATTALGAAPRLNDADVAPASLAPIPLATGAQLLRSYYKGNLMRGLITASLVFAGGLGV